VRFKRRVVAPGLVDREMVAAPNLLQDIDAKCADRVHGGASIFLQRGRDPVDFSGRHLQIHQAMRGGSNGRSGGLPERGRDRQQQR